MPSKTIAREPAPRPVVAVQPAVGADRAAQASAQEARSSSDGVADTLTLTHTNGRVHPEAHAPSRTPAIDVADLRKDYQLSSNVVHALRGISLKVMQGEFVAVMGPSGSGKSTFMNLIGCLDRPSSGTYKLDGVDVTRLRSSDLATLRGRKLGFIFQGFNLLPRMDALENVMLPMMYGGVSTRERHERAQAALEAVGLADRARHRPNELSGGQQQRVAIARSLVNSPSVILADEPTGNLDSRTSVEILGILQALNQAGATIVLVTHEPDIAGYCTRTVVFKDGLVVSDQPNNNVVSAATVIAGLPAVAEEEEVSG